MNLQKGKSQGTHSTPQSRGPFNNPRVSQAPVQVSRQEEYIRQGTGYTPQSVPNPAGLYVSQGGGVAGGPGPQPAPPLPAVAMSGTATAHPNSQGTAPQQTGVIPGQIQPQRAQNLFYRQNVPHFQNLGWPSHNAMNIQNSAPQVSGSFQPTPVPNVPYLPPTAAAAAYSLQHQAIMRGQPVNVTTYQYSPTQAQYNMQQPQQMYLSTPGNANFTQYAAQRQLFFPQVLTQMPPNRNSMPPLYPQQAAQQQNLVASLKRERKPARLQNPDTLEDINLNNDLELADHSTSDFSIIKEGSQMEPVPLELAPSAVGTRDQFAQQILAVAVLPKEPQKQGPSILPLAVGQGMLVPPPLHTDLILEPSDRVNSVMALDHPDTKLVDDDEFVEEVPEYALGTPVPDHEVVDNLGMNGMNPSEDTEVCEPYSEDCVDDVEFREAGSQDYIDESVCEPCEDTVRPEPHTVLRTSSPTPPPIYQQQETTVIPPPASVLPVCFVPTLTENLSADNVVQTLSFTSASLPATESSPPKDSPTPESEEVVQEEKVEAPSKLHQNGDIESSHYDFKDVSDATDNKKKIKKKVRDLKKKGEDKEECEMDAFVVDSAEEENSSKAKLILPVASEVVQSVPDCEIDAEELRKVAEKNQENTRISGQENEVLAPPLIEVPQTKPQVLKYAYKEDQWSPLNLEGKKQYDRAFLLTLQSQPMSLKMPEGLPNLDVIKEIANQFKLRDHSSRPAQAPMQPAHRGNQPDFMPSYAHSGSPRAPQSGGGNRRPSQHGRDKPKKIITISTSWSEDVKLHASENAWKPTNKVATEAENVEDAKTLDLYKKVRGILNKLTPQKFLTLVEQVKDMPIDTEERLKGVIDLVFEKAVDEPNFSVPYAKMCNCLAMKAVPCGDNQIVNFRKLLLTKCQKEFESDSRDEIRRAERLQEIASAQQDKKKQLTEEIEEELRKSRIRSLGNIKFIGELYKLGMLVTHIMHDCVLKLLKAKDEDSLECLCRLLTTVGKELENDKKLDSSEKKALNKTRMDSYFEDLKKTVDIKSTSSRVRFMIQDIIELRLNNWVPRRIENNPKTIDQIHLEAEREAHERQMLAQQPLPQSSNKRPDDRDRRKNRSMQGGFEDGGWNTVGGNKGRGSASFNYDPSKGTPKLVSKLLETDSIQLGPSTRSWNRGSSGGGTRPTSQDSDLKSSIPANRFHALASQDSEPRRTLHQSTSSSREPSRGSQGSSGPPMIGKRPSQNSEREKAAAVVKSFFEPNSAEPNIPNNRNSVAEPSRNSPDTKEAVPPVAPEPVVPVAIVSVTKEQDAPEEYKLIGHDLDQDQMTKKATPIIEEYLHNDDIMEATQCILELASPNSIDMFVSASVNCVLERSSKARAALGLLLRELLVKQILNRDQMFQGLELIFESVMDLEIDIPKVWQYLGEILFPVVQDSTLTLAQLRKPVTICIQQQCGGKFYSSFLHVMAEHLGPNQVKELWDNSGLQWADILSKDEDITKFVIANKLEFTITGAPSASTEEFSVEQCKLGLDNLLKKDSSNKAIFDWIEAKVEKKRLSHPSFIRALVTSITESAIEEGSPENWDCHKIKDRGAVLTRYIANQEHLELQALYALQALDNRLQHPQGMLVRMFEALYDEDVISEDAFGQWEKSTDPVETEGKGVALKSVTSFFSWLRAEDGEESVGEN